MCQIRSNTISSHHSCSPQGRPLHTTTMETLWGWEVDWHQQSRQSQAIKGRGKGFRHGVSPEAVRDVQERVRFDDEVLTGDADDLSDTEWETKIANDEASRDAVKLKEQINRGAKKKGVIGGIGNASQ